MHNNVLIMYKNLFTGHEKNHGGDMFANHHYCKVLLLRQNILYNLECDSLSFSRVIKEFLVADKFHVWDTSNIVRSEGWDISHTPCVCVPCVRNAFLFLDLTQKKLRTYVRLFVSYEKTSRRNRGHQVFLYPKI